MRATGREVMASTSHTVSRELDVSVERTFDVVVAEDVLPKVLHRWGPIPAVSGTRDLTGPWDTPGSTRIVELADGNTVREQVLAWERPRLFEYRTYTFHMRSRVAAAPFAGVVHTAWARYMEQCADRTVALAMSGS